MNQNNSVTTVTVRTEELTRLSSDHPALLDACRKLKGVTLRKDDDVKDAGDLYKVLNSAIKAINEEHRILKSPIIEAGKLLDNRKNEILEPLNAAKKFLKGKLDEHARWTADQERKAQEAVDQAVEQAAERAADQGRTEDAERILQQGSTAQAEKSGPVRSGHSTVSQKKTWKFLGIKDVTKVPQRFMVVDTKAVNLFIRAEVKAGRKPAVPGLDIQHVIEAATR